jgi:hypothetical protein
MSEEKGRGEKEEKGDDDWGGEKWSEKWSRDPLGTFIWALILIWAGVAFLLVNLSGDDGSFLGMDSGNVWAWILAGAGVLIWIEVLVRVAMPAYRRPIGGRIILGTILVMIGVGEVADVELWPLIIIAIGIALLLGYFGGPRRL